LLAEAEPLARSALATMWRSPSGFLSFFSGDGAVVRMERIAIRD
jgi:hypothetical protein